MEAALLPSLVPTLSQTWSGWGCQASSKPPPGDPLCPPPLAVGLESPADGVAWVALHGPWGAPPAGPRCAPEPAPAHQDWAFAIPSLPESAARVPFQRRRVWTQGSCRPVPPLRGVSCAACCPPQAGEWAKLCVSWIKDPLRFPPGSSHSGHVLVLLLTHFLPTCHVPASLISQPAHLLSSFPTMCMSS